MAERTSKLGRQEFTRRALIGLGTPLGRYLVSCGKFQEYFTYEQASNGIPYCDEAVLIVPAGNRFGGSSLRPEAQALLAALKRAAARIVLLSSVSAYSAKGVPFDETAKPSALPGKAWLPKLEEEALNCGTPAAILRLPDIFGTPIFRGLPGCLAKSDASGINRVAIHQLYPVRRLEGDIAV
ncbi:MAG: hypothetical protein HY765_06630, partial [Rhodomicrobium sp.]|nr:hypothetical protein [Rhodomicrobium sp.]